MYTLVFAAHGGGVYGNNALCSQWIHSMGEERRQAGSSGPRLQSVENECGLESSEFPGERVGFQLVWAGQLSLFLHVHDSSVVSGERIGFCFLSFQCHHFWGHTWMKVFYWKGLEWSQMFWFLTILVAA